MWSQIEFQYILFFSFGTMGIQLEFVLNYFFMISKLLFMGEIYEQNCHPYPPHKARWMECHSVIIYVIGPTFGVINYICSVFYTNIVHPQVMALRFAHRCSSILWRVWASEYKLEKIHQWTVLFSSQMFITFRNKFTHEYHFLQTLILTINTLLSLESY